MKLTRKANGNIEITALNVADFAAAQAVAELVAAEINIAYGSDTSDDEDPYVRGQNIVTVEVYADDSALTVSVQGAFFVKAAELVASYNKQKAAAAATEEANNEARTAAQVIEAEAITLLCGTEAEKLAQRADDCYASATSGRYDDKTAEHLRTRGAEYRRQAAELAAREPEVVDEIVSRLYAFVDLRLSEAVQLEATAADERAIADGLVTCARAVRQGTDLGTLLSAHKALALAAPAEPDSPWGRKCRKRYEGVKAGVDVVRELRVNAQAAATRQ